MKKISFSLILALVYFVSSSQISLTYSNHSFRGSDSHITREASYVSEGSSGPNQTWDFSDLSCTDTKSAFVKNYDNKGDKFQKANFEVADGESTQYYMIDNNSNKYIGFESQSTILIYDNPIVKMKYPFTYGNSFSGDFSGKGIFEGASQIDVFGNYNVLADAYGTLILPNNVINNVIRIKTITNTTEVTQCSSFQIESVKYTWYSSDLRYPILMITVVTEKSNNNTEKVKKYVYYNERITENRTANVSYSELDNIDNLFTVYPNPFKDNLSIDYNLAKDNNVSIIIYNYLGEKVDVVVDNQMQNAGNHSISYDKKVKSLNSGVYFVKYIIDNKSYLKKVIKTEN